MTAPEVLGAEEVRLRATAGAALLGARGILIYVVGIGSSPTMETDRAHAPSVLRTLRRP